MDGPGQEFRAPFWILGVSEHPSQPFLRYELRQHPHFPNSKIENINSYLKVTREFGDYLNKRNLTVFGTIDKWQ